MAKVRLEQTGMHVPWRTGEIVTVQVTAELGDGLYECDSLETYPADLKDQHAAELVARDASHAEVVADLRSAHAAEVERLSAVSASPPPAIPQPPVPSGTSAQHQKDLAEHLARSGGAA